MKKRWIILIVLVLVLLVLFIPTNFLVFFKQTCLEVCNEKGFSNAQCVKSRGLVSYSTVDIGEDKIFNSTYNCRFEAWTPLIEGKKIPYVLEEFSDCHNKKIFGAILFGIIFPYAGSSGNICCCSNQ